MGTGRRERWDLEHLAGANSPDNRTVSLDCRPSPSAQRSILVFFASFLALQRGTRVPSLSEELARIDVRYASKQHQGALEDLCPASTPELF